MDIDLDISDVISEFGAHYRAGGQGRKNLISKLYASEETASDFKYWPTDNTVEDFNFVFLNGVLQPFQNDFTGSGSMKFAPNSVALDHQKIDLKINPYDIIKSWLGFLSDNSLSPAKFPLIAYMIEEHILSTRNEEMELLASFKGVFAIPAAVSGVAQPGTPAQSLNGIRKRIRAYNTAGRSNVVATGALESDPADFCAQIEAFVQDIDETYRPFIKNIYMSTDNTTRYRNGRRAGYNLNYSQVDDLLAIDNSNAKVVGRRSMAGSNMIWCTLESNKIRPEKRSMNKNIFDVQPVDRYVKLLTDWFMCLDFKVPEVLFHNDLDLS